MPTRTPQDCRTDECEIDRNAFNAAFYELGLRWHWDSDTYDTLATQACERQRVRGYIEAEQPHLLRAYDADFLTDAILRTQRRTRHAGAQAAATAAPRLDGPDARACGLGA